jgi:hypothetical protein
MKTDSRVRRRSARGASCQVRSASIQRAHTILLICAIKDIAREQLQIRLNKSLAHSSAVNPKIDHGSSKPEFPVPIRVQMGAVVVDSQWEVNWCTVIFALGSQTGPNASAKHRGVSKSCNFEASAIATLSPSLSQRPAAINGQLHLSKVSRNLSAVSNL